MQELVPVGLLLLGLVIGAAVAWRLNPELSQLRERVSRLPELEADQAKLQAVSEELAKRSQAEQLAAERIRELEADNDDLTAQLAKANLDLSAASERKAALEERVNHLSRLEQDIRLTQEELATLSSTLSSERQSSGAEIARIKTSLEAEKAAFARVSQELANSKERHESAEKSAARLDTELAELRSIYEAEKKAVDEKLSLVIEARQALTEQFKNLANEILEEKSKRFAEQNQSSIGQLLAPLKVQLSEFKGKVEEVYIQEGKDRSVLAEQVRQLMSLNQALSQDAKNLTTALKGSAKTQGNWGELILSRVLEESGLRRDHEYVMQESQKREDGTRAQPDVVINLPEERRLVVDSKVSLVAYDEHVRAESEEQRHAAMLRHLDSVRTHIRDLSMKEYQKLYGLKSLDFVLMFIPIEPAFHLAISGDDSLFMSAWEKNVLLVCPSTLLFVVRTVAHLWRQEAQSRNALDIAKRGAELYDKLVDFVKDLEAVGKKLRDAQDSFESAHKRLVTGKGNVIRQAEMLRDLGVKPSKALSAPLVEASARDDDLVAMTQLSQLAASNTPHEPPKQISE